MTFEQLHKGVLFCAVILGLLPLATSGELPLPVVAAAYGAIVAAWFYDAPLERVATHTRWWNVATVSALSLLAIFGYATGNWLLYAVFFALVMVVTRLFQSRGSRDAFQLYGLTFVSIIAGAVINPTLGFVFTFIPYVVLLVWGLILLHLQRDIEVLREEQRALGERPSDLLWQARHLVTGRFLAGSSVLALAIFAISLMVFFFFPRLGMGFFFSQGRQTQSVSGFSDRIELGHFGTIKDNMRVVMRVEFQDDRTRSDRHLRMRGISFDHYDGRVWSKTVRRSWEMPREALGTWRVQHAASRDWQLPGTVVHQDIYLEPLDMDERMIFGMPRAVRLSIDNPELDRLRRHPVRFFQSGGGDISTRVPSDVALRYHVESFIPRQDTRFLDAVEGPVPPMIARLYLQLPPDLNPSIPELASQITADETTTLGQIRAIEAYLRASYGYSVQGGHDRLDPLGDFLFRRKEGHCEYFASAMVVLLRTLDIPARPANGFFGGVYNEFGRFYAIRQADAHSWVEAFFPGFGWMTYDPTPPGAVLVPATGGFWGSAQEWYDSLKLQWYKWVVEYDLEKQLTFFRAVGEAMGDLRDLFPRPQGNVKSPQAWKDGAREWATRPMTWLVLASPFLLLFLWRTGIFHAVMGLVRDRWRRWSMVPDGAMAGIYTRMLRLLAKQGIGRGSTETPRELATRLGASGYGGADAVDRITQGFESARYAEREPSAEALDGFETDLRNLRKVG